MGIAHRSRIDRVPSPRDRDTAMFTTPSAETFSAAVGTGTPNSTDDCQLTAVRLYDAEVALHCARQSEVDAWVKAACEKLHAAIESHSVAVLRLADSLPRVVA
jgi:hypothetical protein